MSSDIVASDSKVDCRSIDVSRRKGLAANLLPGIPFRCKSIGKGRILSISNINAAKRRIIAHVEACVGPNLGDVVLEAVGVLNFRKELV